MMIHSVALLGASGNLGQHVFRALIAHGFDVTVLQRASSKSPSAHPQTVRVSDEFPVDELTEVLRGQDAVVVTINGSETALQKRLAEACVRAGVQRFIPADFGSCDSASALTQATVPLYREKTAMREYLSQLSARTATFSWTSIVCGHFFDWSVEFLHIWPGERRADVLDDGATKWSTSTLAQVAEATARVLLRPAVARNRMIYVQSFLVSQNEVIAAFERATGSEWKVTKYDSEEYLAQEKRKRDAGEAASTENLVWVLGTIDANWERRGDAFAMDALGMSNGDLYAEAKRVVEAQLGSACEENDAADWSN